MPKVILSCFILLISIQVSAQKLCVQGVLFDEHDIPISVERTYLRESDSSIYYVAYDNAGSKGFHHTSCTIIRKRQLGDTTEVDEIENESSQYPDSIVLTNIKDIDNYKADIDWNELKPIRTNKKYYCGRKLISTEYWDDTHTCTAKHQFFYAKRKIYYVGYEMKDNKWVKTSSDTISWNADSSIITAKSVYQGKVIVERYSITGSHLQVGSGTNSAQFSFLQKLSLQQILDWLISPPNDILTTVERLNLTGMSTSDNSNEIQCIRDNSGHLTQILFLEKGKQSKHYDFEYK